jgi:chromosomal replication initiation ATPase DnaA
MHWPWSFPHLWIFGPQGCGKTHLAKLWNKQRHAEWVDPTKLHALNRQAHCYIIDFGHTDPQTLDQTHVYSFLIHVQEYNKTCLWLSRYSSALWQGPLADVASRVRPMVSAEIKAPDDELLAKVLEKTLMDIGWKIHPRLISFLIRRMPRSFAGVSELTNLVKHYAVRNGLSLHHLKTILRCIESTPPHH